MRSTNGNGLVLSGPAISLDVSFSLDYLRTMCVGVDHLINAVKAAVADAVNATATNALLQASALAAVALGMPGVLFVQNASVAGADSFQGTGGPDPYFLVANDVVVRCVRIEPSL